MPYEQLPLFSKDPSADVSESEAAGESLGWLLAEIGTEVIAEEIEESAGESVGQHTEAEADPDAESLSKTTDEIADGPEGSPSETPLEEASGESAAQAEGAGRALLSPGEELRTTLLLSDAAERFGDYMVRQDYAENTVKSFLGDLHILAEFLKMDLPVGEIGTSDLESFLHWLLHERGKPCSPKSYARRLTSLKAFFGWLNAADLLSTDPAASLVHKPVQTPLPRVLSDSQLQEVLTVTRVMMQAEKPDPRPHLLISLLVQTGIKKQECMAIKLAHLDVSNPAEMVLHVRYSTPRMLHKERRLRLPEGWGETLVEYRKVYEPEEYLFPCTARNLEYVLTNVAKRASLLDGLSFETLRWTCAVRDYQARMDADLRRRKLGLSKTSWKDTESKIARLAEPPL